MLALELYLAHRRDLSKTHPEVIALSELLQRLPIHPLDVRNEAFRNPDGVARKLGNLRMFDPERQAEDRAAGRRGSSNTSAADQAVWDHFAGRLDQVSAAAERVRLLADLLGTEDVLDEPEDDAEYEEGRLALRYHRARERNQKAVRDKKAHVLRAGGPLACQVCGFDFATTYGPVGDGYIECHHVIPLSEASGAPTRLSDLILVCANCHRMLHRSRPAMSPDELVRAMGPPVHD